MIYTAKIKRIFALTLKDKSNHEQTCKVYLLWHNVHLGGVSILTSFRGNNLLYNRRYFVAYKECLQCSRLKYDANR
jgi:hypothetical protein